MDFTKIFYNVVFLILLVEIVPSFEAQPVNKSKSQQLAKPTTSKPATKTVKPTPTKKTAKPTPTKKTAKPTPTKKTAKPMPTKKTVKPTPTKKTTKVISKPTTMKTTPKPTATTNPALNNTFMQSKNVVVETVSNISLIPLAKIQHPANLINQVANGDLQLVVDSPAPVNVIILPVSYKELPENLVKSLLGPLSNATSTLEEVAPEKDSINSTGT